MLAGYPEASIANDVAGIRMVALVKYASARRKRSWHGDLGEALKLALLKASEERHAAQQLDSALLNLPHAGDYLSAAVALR